ncbi:patched family-domain-containing protein [Halteromyces radiatus]|uniref:patched family-domain-containing protein n=1 Tax=Halteromyces radiatus TaxID=101107 RepID=UPI0022203C46|nr:patched family-domain-containing protein [Halteromyces radiatus]KAI8093242.1 patched family-domain-containing protein [Halteromyces radiatus]
MRGQCDSSMFSRLPCVDNGPATLPETDNFRQQLVETCGTDYEQVPVCCDEQQFNDLVTQVKRAEPMISSCPACWKNFMQFWCSFTCSPNQSTFVNITNSYNKNGHAIVDQADYWVGEQYGAPFFDSCKDVKFGSSNGYAMDFIGGGATNWQDMVKFMGKKQLLGSPFQIDFPSLEATPRDGLTRYDDKGESCGGDGPYRCACVDCQDACPMLPPTERESPECYVGLLRCWTFAMITSYASILILVFIWFLSRQRWMMTWIQQYWWQDEHDAARGAYEPLALTEDQYNNNNNNNNDDDDDDDVDDNREENLLDPDHTPRRYWMNTRIQNWFYYQGLFCARYPWLVICSGLVFITLLSAGWSRFSLERDPVNLWVSPTSEALAQKNHFDEHFSPFYRTTQLFLVSEDESKPFLSTSRLEHLFALQEEIKTMNSNELGISLQDVCFHPTGDACIVQSITGYWQDDINNFDPDNWREDLEQCIFDPTSCLPESLQPLKPQMILGGYSTDKNDIHYIDAKAVVVTFVLRNSLDPIETDKAQDWEVSLLSNILSKVNDRPEWEGVRITYSTESSLEIELNQSSNTDGKTVAISYLVMFLYASIALGRLTTWQPRRLMVESKFSLGICGILIVIFSVSAAVGLFSLTGRKTTLIIAEVIPFLVLAVGVDNIFILCHEFDRRRGLVEKENQQIQHGDNGGGESMEESAAKTLGKMGPSILLSSLSETLAFGLGTLVSMPAVSSFAFVAATAVFVDFLLQVTCFVSCMVLDAKRTEANRIDCFPCIRLNVSNKKTEQEGWFETCWRRGFVPVVLDQKTRIVTCLIFLGLFMFNLSRVPQVALGLDQRLALPTDSYLVPYFNDLDDYFNVGPPVYFVVSGANLTERSRQKQICGRLPGCDERSLATILEQERKRPQVSYIGEPTSVWLDDYFLWMNPNFECCQLKKQKNNHQSRDRFSRRSTLPFEVAKTKKDMELCGDFDTDCQACFPDWSIADMTTLPEGQEFLDFLDIWINMAPSEECPLGGKAGYGDAIVVSKGQNVGTIETSHFRTFHTPLKNQDDFIQAYASAKRIAKDIGNSMDLQVYAYSVFYIFFEQYEQITSMAVELLGLAMVAIFVITSALLGSLRSGTIVMAVVSMILFNVVGTMSIWGISLNAVSLVNLVICVGISVEFCCHIARAFMVSSGTKEERAAKSLVDVGSSVSSL